MLSSCRRTQFLTGALATCTVYFLCSCRYTRLLTCSVIAYIVYLSLLLRIHASSCLLSYCMYSVSFLTSANTCVFLLLSYCMYGASFLVPTDTRNYSPVPLPRVHCIFPRTHRYTLLLASLVTACTARFLLSCVYTHNDSAITTACIPSLGRIN